MSTSAVASSAAPIPSSPPRATRPAQPRPTTFSGPSPSLTGPPIAPPPRTSSQRPTTQSSSTSDRGGGDGTSDRRKDNRDAAPQRANSTRQQSASRSGGRSTSSGNNANPQPVEKRRRDSEASGARTRAAGGEPTAQAASNGGRRENARKETRFGEYILGQTLGEGEFGKVKLGWRRDGGVQVAIKLIRRDSVSPHPNRLSKIYREISILRTLSHPNIVRLHEMVETDRHIGIILEYASGGELFDYILTHRFLKDPPACRLFAQLVSGVGYLHKKGIVHRDLKLENLLLDRNRNIIITDFGFANVFDPTDELGDLENRLGDPVIIKELEKGIPHTDRADGSSLLSILGPGQTRRRGDLMATSCGSPCYAAPELVVSDGLYTGRKVDVWSCGVILYAMLAGYLPFDDDPANPEGDNINLLYKYIVSTPLTFPEYVTPHARDLLRRILVPDPRKRADLFEVARHSWLSPFADIVNKVTSATTGIKDVETITVREPKADVPHLTRSASVREPSSTTHANTANAGHLATRHHAHEQIPAATQPKASGDAKRRTVQVEYVEPMSQTKRGSQVDPDQGDHQDAAAPPPVVHKDASRMERATTSAGTTGRSFAKFMDKQKAPEKGKTRPVSYQYPQQSRANTVGADGAISGGPSRRPSKENSLPPLHQYQTTEIRPSTATNVPTRTTSYARPSAPRTTSNTVQGRIAQPVSGKPYTISNPIPLNEDGRPQTQDQPQHPAPKGHKRANTVGGQGESSRFMSKLMGTSSNVPQSAGRQSIDQPQRKLEKAPPTSQPKSRRFSLLPASFSLRNMSSEAKHERKSSRSNSRQYSHAAPEVQSQPSLAVRDQEGWRGDNSSDTSFGGSVPERKKSPEPEELPPPPRKSTLGKHKKFGDAYEDGQGGGGHGSSGPARRVMDFFRRRGTARSKGQA